MHRPQFKRNWQFSCSLKLYGCRVPESGLDGADSLIPEGQRVNSGLSGLKAHQSQCGSPAPMIRARPLWVFWSLILFPKFQLLGGEVSPEKKLLRACFPFTEQQRRGLKSPAVPQRTECTMQAAAPPAADSVLCV